MPWGLELRSSTLENLPVLSSSPVLNSGTHYEGVSLGETQICIPFPLCISFHPPAKLCSAAWQGHVPLLSSAL